MTLICRPADRLLQGGAANQELKKLWFYDPEIVARMEEVARLTDLGLEIQLVIEDPPSEASDPNVGEGPSPSPQMVGEILGKARVFIRAAETCLPVEDDPDCNAALRDFPWRSGEWLVCRAASDLFDLIVGDGGGVGYGGAADASGWDVETDLGLSWLHQELHILLSKWRMGEWEMRLLGMCSKPEFRVTINRAELKALDRAVALIEKGLEGDRQGASGNPPGEAPSTSAVEGPNPVAPCPAPQGSDQGQVGRAARCRLSAGAKKSARIIAAFYETRGASTNAEIAEQAGANEGYVSRILKPIRETLPELNRDDVPGGRKGQDGSVEAWGA